MRWRDVEGAEGRGGQLVLGREVMPGYQVGAVASHRVFHMHPLRWKREAGESEKLEDALL